ncbi:MAG: hypothetical protein C0467_12990 [Planctomycetaceae bacterium]|nr:hypothetical protein [Planctomycetaceae bacterium]
MELTKPDVLVLTDGSGSASIPRLDSTRRVLDGVGARLIDSEKTVPDSRVYRALREHDADFFAAILARVSEQVAGGYDLVVCDGLEGFNTSHDLCQYLVAAAVANQTEGVRPEVREFPLEAPPASWAGDDSHVLTLGETALHRKLQAAFGYTELALEVQSSLAQMGEAAFSVESMRRVWPEPTPKAPPGTPPYYETFGERRVREGVYAEVIRWVDHVLPMVNRFWNQPVGTPCTC